VRKTPEAIPVTGKTPAPAPDGARKKKAAPRQPAKVYVKALNRRPRPPDLDFSSAERALQAYLALQSAPARRMEEKRIALLRGCRESLIAMMKYMPYENTTEGILLRDGQRIPGTVPLCNEREIVVRRARPRGKTVIVPWNQIAFDQYVTFFEHYANLRLRQGGSEADRRAPNETGGNRIEAAKDYFRLAVLCDWYGRMDAAGRFADKAAELAPALARRIRQYVPTPTQ